MMKHLLRCKYLVIILRCTLGSVDTEEHGAANQVIVLQYYHYRDETDLDFSGFLLQKKYQINERQSKLVFQSTHQCQLSDRNRIC